MRNRWSKVRALQKRAIVAAVIIGSLATYTLFRKSAVTLEVVGLKQELLRSYPDAPSDPRGIVQSETNEMHWVAELELRNNSSAEIQYLGLFSYRHMPNYECFQWTNSGWAGDWGFAAERSAWTSFAKGFGSSSWGSVSLQPGGSLRFRVELHGRGKPSFVALLFKTPRPKIKFYDLLPRALEDRLPWRKEWHQAETEIILNGAKEMPPKWSSKPDTSIGSHPKNIGAVGVGN